MQWSHAIDARDLSTLGVLAPREVRVFFARVSDAEVPERDEALRTLLSEEERLRQSRFHFAHDRQSYLAAHVLTRLVLAPLLGTAPTAIEFEAGEHGRPEVSAPIRVPPLRFNLSHTRGLVACAVALDVEIGVDVEQVARRIELAQLSRQVFSEQERERLFALAGTEQRERFFQLWTLKEAYIKAVGKGLSLPLRAISLRLEQGEQPGVSFGDPIEDHGDDWLLRTESPVPGYMLSAAVRSREEHTFSLREVAL